MYTSETCKPFQYPPIEEQAGIVGKLDCWEELTREIELRQSRFGHYLDKLVD
ncbi:MAG: hypothetical protein OXC57_00750 [Rhodobacteraceae bacterium]|nr:hypothetical protein [Paracoccaceae bacterium]